MSHNDVSQFIKFIEEETKKIWRNEPKDVLLLWNRGGTWGYHFCPVVMGESYVQLIANDLWYLRAAAKNEKTDMETLLKATKIFLDAKGARTKSWFNLEDLSSILKETSSLCGKGISRKDYIDLTEKLVLYVGKVGWWIEQKIPWNELSTFYEMIHSTS